MIRARWLAAALCLVPGAAAAQQHILQQQVPQQQLPQQEPVPQQQLPQQEPVPQQQHANTWAQLPHMQLERQFAGPLQDTIVQRWRDPVDGTVCYIYLPITAQHTPPGATGFVQYGSNTIGSISCVAPPPPPAAPAAQRRSAPRSNAANP
jgi:hypothetical protein